MARPQYNIFPQELGQGTSIVPVASPVNTFVHQPDLTQGVQVPEIKGVAGAAKEIGSMLDDKALATAKSSWAQYQAKYEANREDFRKSVEAGQIPEYASVPGHDWFLAMDAGAAMSDVLREGEQLAKTAWSQGTTENGKWMPPPDFEQQFQGLVQKYSTPSWSTRAGGEIFTANLQKVHDRLQGLAGDEKLKADNELKYEHITNNLSSLLVKMGSGALQMGNLPLMAAMSQQWNAWNADLHTFGAQRRQEAQALAIRSALSGMAQNSPELALTMIPIIRNLDTENRKVGKDAKLSLVLDEAEKHYARADASTAMIQLEKYRANASLQAEQAVDYYTDFKEQHPEMSASDLLLLAHKELRNTPSKWDPRYADESEGKLRKVLTVGEQESTLANQEAYNKFIAKRNAGTATMDDARDPALGPHTLPAIKIMKDDDNDIKAAKQAGLDSARQNIAISLEDAVDRDPAIGREAATIVRSESAALDKEARDFAATHRGPAGEPLLSDEMTRLATVHTESAKTKIAAVKQEKDAFNKSWNESTTKWQYPEQLVRDNRGARFLTASDIKQAQTQADPFYLGPFSDTQPQPVKKVVGDMLASKLVGGLLSQEAKKAATDAELSDFKALWEPKAKALRAASKSEDELGPALKTELDNTLKEYIQKKVRQRTIDAAMKMGSDNPDAIVMIRQSRAVAGQLTDDLLQDTAFTSASFRERHVPTDYTKTMDQWGNYLAGSSPLSRDEMKDALSRAARDALASNSISADVQKELATWFATRMDADPSVLTTGKLTIPPIAADIPVAAQATKEALLQYEALGMRRGDQRFPGNIPPPQEWASNDAWVQYGLKVRDLIDPSPVNNTFRASISHMIPMTVDLKRKYEDGGTIGGPAIEAHTTHFKFTSEEEVRKAAKLLGLKSDEAVNDYVNLYHSLDKATRGSAESRPTTRPGR